MFNNNYNKDLKQIVIELRALNRLVYDLQDNPKKMFMEYYED